MALPGFLELSGEQADYDQSRFVVLPIPYDATTSFQTGTRYGPHAILAASCALEEMDEETLTETHREGIATMAPVAVDASGPAGMHATIYEAAAPVVKDGKFLLGLGGEHGVSSALYRAHQEHYGPLSVLQIDAHLDLRDEYEGSTYSHASVMRRIHDMGTTQIVPVGIRNICAEELAFCKDANITYFAASACHGTYDWIDEAVERLTDQVYVTIDIDGFDPSFAPGTGTPEPGGLDWYQVIRLLRATAARKTIVGADIVEVLPIPGQAVTEFLAARLAYKLFSYVSAAASGTL
ncbi:MAG: agmatinase [Phycisphaerae bacterium]